MTPQELKNSILQLAIQGKLVEQRPEEGTAEELFAQIQAEKQQLIHEKKIKKEKPLPEITEDEKPFDIPESWKWVRFGDISTYNHRKEKISANEITEDMWSLDLEDIEKESGKIINICKASERKISGDKVRFYKGQILYSKLRPYLKKILVAPDDGICSSEMVPFNLYGNVDSQYAVYFLKSPHVDFIINSVTYGVKMPRVGTDTMIELPFPLPPLAEQKRVVAKIEELLPYIDRYEHAWSKLEQFNSRFPEDMKKSLLQYAIQGKLVEQRPEEGTAEELFAQIQQEKQRLIAEKKIKKEKPLPEITEDEKPFDIPESWKWVRVGSLLHYIDTGKSFKCDEIPPTNDKCGIIKVSAVTWGQFKENESKTCYSNDLWVDEYAIHENDFLICRANTAALVGGCVIVDQISKRLMLSDKVLRLHFSEMLYSYYVLWALRTPMVRNQFSAAATGTSESMKNISQDMIKNTLIPLPPLDEQKRIVEKLEQLLPLCEKLQS